MSLITVIVVLAVVGMLVWLVNTYLPIAPPFKKIITAVAVIVVVLWLLGVFGILDLGNIRVGHVR